MTAINTATVNATEAGAPSEPVMTPTEQWDRRVFNDIRHALRRTGVTIPDSRTIRIRTGYSPKRRPGRMIHAEFIPGNETADGVPQVYVSPSLDDAGAIMLAILREAIRAEVHAAIPDVDDGSESTPAKREKIATERRKEFAARLRKVGITTGGRVDATPEADSALHATIAKALTDHGARPHGAIAHDAKNNGTDKTYSLKAECPDCGSPMRKTLSAVQKDWPTCAGNGNHPLTRRVFAVVTGTDGNVIDITATLPAAFVVDNGDGTFSPAY